MTVVRGVRGKEVDEAVFGLQPGALSAPVRRRQGLLIFQLRNHYPAQLQSLDAATPQVTRRLTAQNQERLWKALQDRVWRDQAVEVRDDVLKAAMPAASPAPAPANPAKP